MNSKYINAYFANKHFVTFPSMVEWRKLEFFIFGEFLIRERRYDDPKYLNILKTLALSDFLCSSDQSVSLVTDYVSVIKSEALDFESFNLKYYSHSQLTAGVQIYRDYGSDGINVLNDRRFVKRSTLLLERLFAMHKSQGFIGNSSLGVRFTLLGVNGVYAEMGLLVLKRRTYFGQNLTRELGFFLWFLNLALDSEDYAVKYVASKNVEDLERTYGAFVKKNGGMHQTVVKLTREVRAGLRRFE